MHGLVWVGLVLLALGVLAWFVFKVTIYIAVGLFLVGVALMIWGAVKAKQAID